MEVLIYPNDRSGYCELYEQEKKTQMTFLSVIKHGDKLYFYFRELPNSTLLADEIDTIEYHFDQEVCFIRAFQFLQLSFPYREDLENKNNFETFKSYCRYFDKNPPK